MRIKIIWEKGEITAELEKNQVTDALAEKLPFESEAKRWGDEIYFEIPIETVLEEKGKKQIVDPGSVCLWAEGKSIAIPFGPTPMSEEGECKMITNVNILGKMDGDPRALDSVQDGMTVKVESAD